SDRKADKLLALALEKWRPGRTETGSPMAVPLDGAPLAVIVGDRMGDRFRDDLAHLSYEHFGEVPAGSVLGDVARVWAVKGRVCDPEDVLLRVGYTPDQSLVVYDLGRSDHSAVAIEPGAWSVVPDLAGTVFRRSSVTKPQVLPSTVSSPGDLNLMAAVLNLSDAGWQVLRSLMVVSLIPDVPKPIGVLTGEAGSGKTDATRFVLQVLDPQAAELQPPPKNMRDLLVSADASMVLAFDNLSAIDQDLSDAMCRLATGTGVRNRSLYTDRELAVFDQMRAVFINGIDLGELRGDLVDRAVPIGLVRISQEDRMTERDIQAKFRELLPRILGGLFATIAEAWARLPHIQLETLPRMADAAVWFAAVDEVFQDLGVESRSLELLTSSKESLYEAIVESDELAMATVSFMERQPGATWSGTASDLRRHLADGSDATWLPSTAALLGTKLRSSATPLREAGILDFTFERSGADRTMHISRMSRWPE
ncbi:MAG: hypothetical protein O7C01_00725, partial [Actinobacteria bacterium]|nr:hypothetical protein [Actinomycetota bacterium]